MFILVSGAAASGKSAHAENILCDRTPVNQRLYIACMQPFGADAEFRIARHKALRAGKGFDTLERYTDMANWTANRPWSGILLECLSNLLANEVYATEGAHENAVTAILEGIAHLRTQTDTLVVVTNEVFADGLPYDADTIAYIHKLGQLNCALAAQADVVVESVCGILVTRKGKLS